jgi:hypothetical protein
VCEVARHYGVIRTAIGEIASKAVQELTPMFMPPTTQPRQVP